MFINAAIVLCVAALGISAVQVYFTAQTYAKADDEYAGLRETVSPQEAAHSLPAGEGYSVPGEVARLPQELNPDYIAWLAIPGTKVDYPVVQGADNERYLNYTFEGVQNPAGCLFIDYRVAGDFSGYNTVIYGHSMNNGSMFGELHKYLDAAFLAQHSTFTVITADGRVLTYKIFAARQSNSNDFAYQYAFADAAGFEAFAAGLGAPAGTQQVLTLSTCAKAGESTGRILVHAALQ